MRTLSYCFLLLALAMFSGCSSDPGPVQPAPQQGPSPAPPTVFTNVPDVPALDHIVLVPQPTTFEIQKLTEHADVLWVSPVEYAIPIARGTARLFTVEGRTNNETVVPLIEEEIVCTSGEWMDGFPTKRMGSACKVTALVDPFDTVLHGGMEPIDLIRASYRGMKTEVPVSGVHSMVGTWTMTFEMPDGPFQREIHYDKQEGRWAHDTRWDEWTANVHPSTVTMYGGMTSEVLFSTRDAGSGWLYSSYAKTPYKVTITRTSPSYRRPAP